MTKEKKENSTVEEVRDWIKNRLISKGPQDLASLVYANTTDTLLFDSLEAEETAIRTALSQLFKEGLVVRGPSPNMTMLHWAGDQ